MSAHIEAVDSLHDHWWWRPGWRAGRHYYACHITLGGRRTGQAAGSHLSTRPAKMSLGWT